MRAISLITGCKTARIHLVTAIQLHRKATLSNFSVMTKVIKQFVFASENRYTFLTLHLFTTSLHSVPPRSHHGINGSTVLADSVEETQKIVLEKLHKVILAKNKWLVSQDGSALQSQNIHVVHVPCQETL